MNVEKWFLVAVFVLFIGLLGCGNKDDKTIPTQLEVPASQASSAQNELEKFYDSRDLVKAALTMARDLTVVSDMQGKFAGYGSVDAIAKRTNARGNVHWNEFASMLSGSKLGPYGYHTPLGDFVLVSGTTPDQKQIGLVVNLENQKTALYLVGSREIAPAGDNLASALVVALEVENKAKSTFASTDYTPTELRAQTILSLERALGQTASIKSETAKATVNSSTVSSTGAYAEAIASQKKAIRKDLSVRESQELGQARSNSMDKRVLELFYAVFEDAKKAGLKLNDPRDHIKSVNRGRRNSGVWELTVEPYGPDLRFVVIRDLGTAAGMFSVEGVGAISTNAFIRDAYFDETGNFSENCKYEISQGSRSVKYGCMAFLEGKHDKELLKALRDMVIEEVKEASGRRVP